ncbi:NADH-quinone oxidoreductase subunit NuoE [Dethiobacter alkaliphilus]|uniref:NADH dehydrogenase (Ubiquinone) 24 kDa subunit n=1 Tax=Dethiobacter alkaliphilus AHT 1 TaxID=555088 RepID=C0GH17_DETAL|nr:NADH-quinone oxidoreductase subunit NuoE [Dethiobacter alkaliphilus]EEG77319.1 NADH dehydrogenase (ubiquinone) 24 kDa subunit [Dethiobacter alkaliphilus AHT 1]MCW3490134.1 NADH-quinone oxidoreductase subunit NuoE [Dethiobacter alkaliphilus]
MALEAAHEKCTDFIANGTHHKMEALMQKYQGKPEMLITVLQQAQDIYGFLPESVLLRIAEALDLSMAKIYGVVTFYSQFHLKPRGRNVIRVCQGTACHVRGVGRIMDKIKEELGIAEGETSEDLRFTLESVACIGACGLAPVIMINNDTHGRLTADRVKLILPLYE